MSWDPISLVKPGDWATSPFRPARTVPPAGLLPGVFTRAPHCPGALSRPSYHRFLSSEFTCEIAWFHQCGAS